MVTIVTKYGRQRAVSAAGNVVQHQLDRIWDALQEAMEAANRGEITKAMLELNKITSLAGSARSGCNVWMSLQADNERAAALEAAGKEANDREVRAITEAPYADQVVVNEPAPPAPTSHPADRPIASAASAGDCPF